MSLAPLAVYRAFSLLASTYFLERMMGETAHIGEIAEKLSDQLFAEFFWEKEGPTNQNWPCEKTEAHKCQEHPADVVFWYDDPYKSVRTYIHCDLKSYAKASINTTQIKSAIESLAKQISCAAVSQTWQETYASPSGVHEVVGLLFVYNHDIEYDKDFDKLLNKLYHKVDIPKNTQLFVLGPDDIHWIDNVRFEICSMRGSVGPNRLPDRHKCRYFYPHQVRRSNIRPERGKAATLEMLLSSWIILEYDHPDNPIARGIVVFYKNNVENIFDFMYLLDYFRHFQLLDKDIYIQIKFMAKNNKASLLFQKAKNQYIDDTLSISDDEELSILIKRIKCSAMIQAVSTFSVTELGMGYEGR